MVCHGLSQSPVVSSECRMGFPCEQQLESWCATPKKMPGDEEWRPHSQHRGSQRGVHQLESLPIQQVLCSETSELLHHLGQCSIPCRGLLPLTCC